MKSKSFKINTFYTVLVLLILLVLVMVTYSKYLENKYPWHIYQNNSYQLLDDYSGEGVTIAFLDTGLHYDLIESFGDRIVNPYNVIEDNSNIIDTNGHGTEMMCVSSCKYEKNGIYGLAYNANIMPVVVMDDTGRTSGEYINKGIVYAVDNGADIINLSLGSRLENDLVKEAIEYAYENNVIVVSSVGDYQEEKVLYPAKYDSVVAVQSQSKLGVKYKDSSWGEEVDLLIPGEFIETLGINIENNNLETKYESGSSISTAYLTSVLALMIEKHDDYTVDEVMNYIQNYNVQNEFINLNKFVKGFQ